MSPKLRDSANSRTRELWQLGQIPDEAVRKIGAYLVYLLAYGKQDITGDEWGDAFAYAIGGTHLKSPLGIADVVYGHQAWSCKTVKKKDPFKSGKVRLISGRNSPTYSDEIKDAYADIQHTGISVLGIWNARVNIAHDHYNPVRTIVLVRSDDLTKYAIYEEATYPFPTNEFLWNENSNHNLEGSKDGRVYFTWQPHGSQFTIHSKLPADCVKFKIKKPEPIPMDNIWQAIGYDDTWVQILK